MIESLLREINQAKAWLCELKQIRVTQVIPEGAMWLIPLKAELRCQIAPVALPSGEIVPDESTERMRELLVHPADWLRVLTDPRVRHYVSGDVTGFCGIKVVNG